METCCIYTEAKDPEPLTAISHTARFCSEPRGAAGVESHSTARNRLRDGFVGLRKGLSRFEAGLGA